MKLTNIREAACMQANYLINQISSKKGYKQVGNEIAKMSEIFGIEFDKHIYKSLLEDIDFKDQRGLVSSRNNSNKIVFLVQEFPGLLARPDFISIFSHIMEYNNSNATAAEFFEGLVKLLKLNIENQFKILLSFFYSGNPKYQEDAKVIFMNKCVEIHKEFKSDQLTKQTIQMIIMLINSHEEMKQNSFLKTQFLSYLLNKQLKYSNNSQGNQNNNLNPEVEDFTEEFSKILEDDDDSTEFEKIITDLGPWMINNSINLSKSELINTKLDEKRLAYLIMFICRHPNCNEDKESRFLNKIFLQALNNDLSMTIDEYNEKKVTTINWNLENYYKMSKNTIESLDLALVFSFFDDAQFTIKDKKSLDIFIFTMKNLKVNNYQTLLLNLLLKRWNNELNQIDTLIFLINNKEFEAFSFKNSVRKVKRNFELAFQINKNSMNFLIENWSSIDLIETLIKLARGNNYLKIKEIFEWPITNIPEILVIALSLLKVDEEDFLYEELICDVLPPFLGNHINSIAVLEEVWSYNRDLVIRTICNLYRSNPDLMNLSRILDITQKLKDSLIPISSCNDHNFTVNLAILAVKRDFLHIDQWLTDRIGKIGDDFIESLLNYIKENVIKQCKDITSQSVKENILEKCQLTLESLAIIFENLSIQKLRSNSKVSKRILTEITSTYKEIFELFDELQTQPQNSEEIEEAANKLFHSLFHGESSISIIIETMNNYKNSPNQKESEIYACMIHSLLDEYKFFHKYPDKELKLVATLFGQIINHNLLDGVIETISVKFVIEGIKKNTGKMFIFSTIALDQFVDKLHLLPQYAQAISQVIPVIKLSHPSLYERATEKFNEINNKSKLNRTSSININIEENPINSMNNKQPNVNYNQSTNPNNNYINFDGNLYENEKNKGNLNNVAKMPDLNKNDFYKNYQVLNNQQSLQMNAMNSYNMPNNSQFGMNYMQSQQGNMNKNLNPNQNIKENMNYMNTQNMNYAFNNPDMYNMNNFYYSQNANNANANNSNVNMNNVDNKKLGNNPNPTGLNPNLMKDKDFKEEAKDKNLEGFDSFNSQSGLGMINDFKNSNNNPRFKEDEHKFPAKLSDEGMKGKEFDNENTRDFNTDKSLNFQQNQKKNILKINNTTAKNIDMSHFLQNENSIQAPVQEVVDKINFIFNSMSKINISDKSNELKSLLTNENIIKWFSNFFILNRVSGENNNHNNYGELISNINSKELNELLVKDTILIIKKLLISEKLVKDNSERNILKHLGSWLGIMTLARNKPILSKDLDLKELIYEAYQNGKLTAVVPFCCRILDHSSKTKVFHPKNPWIQAIMSVLLELFNKPLLRITLRFEIENIFKKIEVDMSTLIQTHSLDALIVVQSSIDFTRDNNTYLEAKYSDLFPLINTNLIDNYSNELQDLLKESNQNNIISKNEIINLVTTALVNAINDIISPVVERAVNISLVTTKELVLKDFAFDCEEKKFQNAANSCIKSLAGSLAMVTCKEPLRMSFINHFKELLSKKLFEEVSIEYINNIKNSDILDIGCNFIQNNVIKRAVDKIEKDRGIIDEIEKRRKKKTIEPKPEFINKINSLPEILKPFTNGLTNDQYKIYEDFERVYDSNRKDLLKKNALIKMIIPLLWEFIDFSTQNNSKLPNRYELCLKNIENIAVQHTDTEYVEDDENIAVLSKMFQESKITESVALELLNTNCKYVINSAKSRNITLVNLYSEILKGWVKLHPRISKEVTIKLLTNDDISIRFIYDIHFYFLKKNIFEKNEYEKICLKYFEDNTSCSFIRKLFSELINKNFLLVKDLKIIPHYMVDKMSNTYYELFFNKSVFNYALPNLDLTDWKIVNIRDNENYVHFKEMAIFTFSQIMTLYYKGLDNDTLKNFLKTFNESSISKSEDQMNALISMITEYSVKECMYFSDSIYAYPDRLLYHKIDNLAKFIFLLLNFITNSNKLKFFENILFGIFKILHLDYTKNQQNFNQKPYYRLFINLIYLLYVSDNNDVLFTNNKKIHYFFVLADFIRILRPQNYPGFATAWLDIISYKYFSSMFLDSDGNKARSENLPRYEKYLVLVTDNLSFLKIYGNDIIKDYSVQIFLKLVYKYMYLLVKTYPEFVSYYYFVIINALPSEGFLQMKNIILYASPSDIELPDPFSEDIKIEQMPSTSRNSIVLFDIFTIMNDSGYKAMIDEFIENKNEMILDEIIKKLNKTDNSQNFQVINSIVIYFSNFSIIKKIITTKEILDIFIKMLKNFELENRDHLINSLLNELRYPSTQTYYFYCLLLCIYNDIKVDHIEELIFKNIIQRLLFKPYPWGILITYLELSRNSKYNQLVKKSYENHSFGIDKVIEDIFKFVNSSKFNKNLDNFVF